MNIVTIELPIYYTDLVVLIEPDWGIANKKLRLKLNEEDLLAHALTTYEEEYNGKHEIFLLLKPNYLDYNTITHELMHVVMFICTLKGIKPDSENDEPLAYLQGYIGEELFKFREKYLEGIQKPLSL